MNETELSHLIEMWNSRLAAYKEESTPYGLGYKDALLECINDIIYFSRPVLMTQDDYEEIMADNYLSSIEAHEIV